MLFHVIPLEATDDDCSMLFTRRVLSSCAGLMQWMTQGMPSTTPFIYAVYQSIGFGKMEGKVKLTYDAKQCIHMCRILTICHVGFPNAMSTQIDAHVYPDTDDYEMWVDACTGKGEGDTLLEIMVMVQQAQQ
jgi:hypothetical protein